jgi:hypothetical protein
MNKEFIPYEQALELKKLGFDEECFKYYTEMGTLRIKDERPLPPLTYAPLYQQAFRWFREKYGFTYSVGSTNIGVVHVGTTFLLQDNASFEDAQFECLKKLIEVAINRIS